MANYRVTVRTADVNWGGTDANVEGELLGVVANSGAKKLDTPADNFEAGRIDRFDLTTPENLGWLESIRFRHDNSGAGDGWRVDWVEVTDVDYGITFKAPFDAWVEGSNWVSKPVLLGPITLGPGVIRSYYIGYRWARQQASPSAPLTVNEQTTWTETRGVSVKRSEATSLELGVSLGFKFFGAADSSISAKVTTTVTNETGAEAQSSVANQSSVSSTIPPGEAQTFIFMLYQSVLEGIGEGNGISVPWEVRYPGHADTIAMPGWLSPQEIADAVRRVLEEQTGQSGTGDPVPAIVASEGMELAIATRSLSGPITPTTVKEALEESDKDRRAAPTNVVGSLGGVVVHG